MSAITINGDLIHYEKLGRGKPVILVHGWIGAWRYWIPLMKQLHLKYSVYTLDLIGFGDSAKNDDRYDLRSQVAMLAQFLEQLAIPKAALVGHGLGAMVCVEFALKYPEKAARVLLTNAPLHNPGDLDTRTPAGHRVLLTPHRDRYSMAPPIPDDVEEDNNAHTISSGHSDPTVQGSTSFSDMPTLARGDQIDRSRLLQRARELQEGRLNPLEEAFKNKSGGDLLDKCFKRSEPEYDKLKVDAEKTDNRVISSSVRTYRPADMLDHIRMVTAPTLIVHGEDDPIMPRPADEVLQYLTVGKEDVLMPILLPGVRHFPMLEYEPFSRLSMDFLETASLETLQVRERWVRRNR